MAFTEKELKQWELMVASFIEVKRPPEEVRSQVDIGYSIKDQSLSFIPFVPNGTNQRKK